MPLFARASIHSIVLGAGNLEVEFIVPLTTNDPTVRPSQPSVSSYKPLLKYFCVRFCVAVTLTVMLLAVVELYAYRRYLHFGSNDALEPAVKLDLAAGGSAEDQEYWAEFEKANKVVYHQYVLWRRASYQGQLLSIDQDGVRRTLNTQCDAKALTIWTFGDSVMWGAGTPDAGTIPSFLALDYEKAGKPACIVNYAEKGWSNSQELIGLIEQLKHAARKPDIVLFYDGGTEAFAAYQSGRADVHSNFNMFQDFLANWGTKQRASFSYLEETNTYRMLDRISRRTPFHRNQGNSRTAPETDTLSSEVVDNYAQNMQIVNLLGKLYDFRPVFAWYPNLAVGHKQLTPYEQQVMRFEDEAFPDLRLMYEAVYQKSAGIKQANFYNLENAVDDQSDSLYVGISHMKAEGNRILADRLFKILEASGSASATANTVHSGAPKNSGS